jgi:thioredoxin-like negative regulator of GroEL
LCGSLLLIASFDPSIAQKQRQATTSIPPATMQEMQALQKILAASPNDPAALFNLAMDYATIGDSAKALDLLGKMAQAHTGIDPRGLQSDLRCSHYRHLDW